MSEDVAQTIAELATDLHNALVSRAAMRAVVTAIFHKRDRSLVRAENMIAPVVHELIETMVGFV
jgi:hypothetical protein